METRRGSGSSGFSLVETLVALLVASVLAAATLTLLEAARRLATDQQMIAEAQGNLRVAQQELVRMLTMAGIGGLPDSIAPDLGGSSTAGLFPTGLALAVDNDIDSDTHIGDDSTPLVVEGSDVLTLRGVFSTPVHIVEPQQALSLDDNGRGSIVVARDVDLGVSQDLEVLRRALDIAKDAEPPHPEAFIVRDRYSPGAFAVLELDPEATFPGETGDPTLRIGLVLGSSGTYADEYGRMILGTTLLAGAGGTQETLPDGTPVQLPRLVGAIGLLEEYRIYLRQDWEIAGNDASRPTPVLSRSRFYPGTDDLHPQGSMDLADDVIDLQVALGVDLPPTDGQVVDTGDENDEVLYNHPDDDDGLTPPPGDRSWAAPDARIAFARLSLVAQASAPDRDFEGQVLGAFEDHDHADPADISIWNTGASLKVRKRYLRTLVELRNLP